MQAFYFDFRFLITSTHWTRPFQRRKAPIFRSIIIVKLWKMKPSFLSLGIQLHFKRIVMLKQINSNHHERTIAQHAPNQYSISRHRKIGSIRKSFWHNSLTHSFLFNRTMCTRDKCAECLKVDCSECEMAPSESSLHANIPMLSSSRKNV